MEVLFKIVTNFRLRMGMCPVHCDFPLKNRSLSSIHTRAALGRWPGLLWCCSLGGRSFMKLFEISLNEVY